MRSRAASCLHSTEHAQYLTRPGIRKLILPVVWLLAEHCNEQVLEQKYKI